MLFHAVVQAEVYLKMRGCPRAAPDEFQRVNTESGRRSCGVHHVFLKSPDDQKTGQRRSAAPSPLWFILCLFGSAQLTVRVTASEVTELLPLLTMQRYL